MSETCDQTITYVTTNTTPGQRTTYRCSKPAGHEHGHYDAGARLSWTEPNVAKAHSDA